ncbi:MAG: AAA family ATPase [Acidimicrobiales bacterium]|nr:AAA family ATPase [Acidimicrobiales bacterium]
MERVSVVGNSGSGKTYFAKLLAQQMGCRHIELDTIFHQADWKSLEIEEFRAVVIEATENGPWVIDGNYRMVRDIVWANAETVIFLDVGFIKNTYRLVK